MGVEGKEREHEGSKSSWGSDRAMKALDRGSYYGVREKPGAREILSSLRGWPQLRLCNNEEGV